MKNHETPDKVLRYSVNASVDVQSGTILLKTMDNNLRYINSAIIHTQEEQTRRALISLGWTPPGAIKSMQRGWSWRGVFSLFRGKK